jgi:hypothetical protein
MHRLGTAFRRWILATLVVPLVLSAASFAATFDLATATVADINAAFDAGALTSEKLTQLYLNRIDAYDKQVTKRRKPPESTPPLPGKKFDYTTPTILAGAQ